MKQAFLSELFSGIQGEGPWVGLRQIFLRFSGCDLRCQWCDTPDSLSIKKTHKFVYETEPATRNFREMIGKTDLQTVLDLLQFYETTLPHHSLTLTGGEPLLQSGFMLELILALRNYNFKPSIYLETGGHRSAELEQVIDLVDFISFDLKLPSSTAERSLWAEHQAFIKLARNKPGYAKIVLTADTDSAELEQACLLLKEAPDLQVVLQKVSANQVFIKEPSPAQILAWQAQVIQKLGPARVRVIPQTHRLTGQL
jgi:7-carboxy-7-deazaguanine synthase